MSEQIYDEQIAPKLAEVMAICKEHGLSFACACEYATGDTGLSFVGPNDPKTTGATMWLADTAIRARGNFDALTFATMKHAREHGHSSVILAKLGVPEKPGSLASPHRLNPPV